MLTDLRSIPYHTQIPCLGKLKPCNASCITGSEVTESAIKQYSDSVMHTYDNAHLESCKIKDVQDCTCLVAPMHPQVRKVLEHYGCSDIRSLLFIVPISYPTNFIPNLNNRDDDEI